MSCELKDSIIFLSIRTDAILVYIKLGLLIFGD